MNATVNVGVNAGPDLRPRAQPASLWRLEFLRLVRTHRLLGLGALFLLLGFCVPILTANLPWLLRHSAQGRDLVATLPDPTPADGINSYVGQISQLGLIVIVVSFAGALCPYGRRQAGLYYWALTRVASGRRLGASAALLLPRFVACAVCTICVFLLGLVGAWYETAVLIGRPQLAALAVGAVFVCQYLIWVLAVVAAIGARAGSSIATASMSVLVIMIVGLAQNLPVLGRVLPTRLTEAPGALLQGASWTDYLPAAGVSVGLTAVLVCVALLLLDRREL